VKCTETQIMCLTVINSTTRNVAMSVIVCVQKKNVSRFLVCDRLRLKCDGTGAETRFRLSTIKTSPFKSAGASVQSTTGSRGVSISGSNAGYTMFRGSVKSTGYPLHSTVFPLLPLPCVTVCHHISTGVFRLSTPSALLQSCEERV
jgi:hypothetical protein